MPTAVDPNAGRTSVGGQALNSYSVNQPGTVASATTAAGGPVHIDTDTSGTGGVNTDSSGKAIAQGQAGAFQIPTLNANITTTQDTAKTPAPSVVTSNAAQQDVSKIGSQLNQANSDSQNQAAAVAANSAQAQQNQQAATKSNTNQSASNPSLDDQIANLIGSMNSDSESNLNQASASQDTLLAQEAQNQADQATAYQNMQSAFDSIRNGTYPLTGAEQAVLTSTQQQFQNTIQLQQTANDAYTGQMKEAMASLGINTSAPLQAIGNIQAAVTSGNSKIADLNSQMSLALSNATVAFQKQDFDELQTQWSNAAQQFASRQMTLNDMLSTVTAQAKAAQDEINTRTTTALSAIMDSNTMDYQSKQLAISQAQLDEKTKDDYTKNLIAEYTAGMTGGGSGNNLPTVDVTSTGAPNPVAQAQFLAQFPPQVASLIKGVATYSINPTSISTSKKQAMGGFTQSQILALASQYDPSFDEKQYATRSAMQKNVTSGAYSQTINSANTAIQHLNELSTDYKALGNDAIPAGNWIGQGIASAFGSAGPNNFKITADAVASELSKIYKGTGAPTESEITNWRDSISDSMSPSQFQGALKTAINLMSGKLSTLSDNYSQVMGQPGNFQILTDKNAQTLQGLGIDPSAVDPTYGNSPTIKLSNFNGASDTNAALLKQVSQIAPDATPDEIVQYLQGQGYQI